MSLDAMLAVFKLPAGSVTTSERWLLMAIAESAGEGGELSHYTRSQDFLCWKCGWKNDRALRTLTRSLQKKNLLEVTKTARDLSYRLTFLDSVPTANLTQLYWQARKEKAAHTGREKAAHTGREIPAHTGREIPAHTGRTHISASKTLFLTPSEKELARWFDEVFWPNYPIKTNRNGALGELLRLAPDVHQQARIYEGLARFARAIDAQEGDDGFRPSWPAPKNWLRDRRWEDEPLR